MPDHFYTTDPKGELALQAGYKYEGIQCYVMTAQDSTTVPVFRYFNSRTGDHFYTCDQNEGTNAASGGWAPEFVGWFMSPPQESKIRAISAGPTGPAGTTPLYRLLLGGTDHFYTTNKVEAEQSGGTYERVAGYVRQRAGDGWFPLYRWYKG
jgi:hypothetical protein